MNINRIYEKKYHKNKENILEYEKNIENNIFKNTIRIIKNILNRIEFQNLV